MIFKVFIALASVLFPFSSIHSCHCALGSFPPQTNTLCSVKKPSAPLFFEKLVTASDLSFSVLLDSWLLCYWITKRDW